MNIFLALACVVSPIAHSSDEEDAYELGPNPYGLSEDLFKYWIVQEGDSLYTPFGFCYVSVILDGSRPLQKIEEQLSGFGYIDVPPDYDEDYENEEEFTIPGAVHRGCWCGVAMDFDYSEENVYFGADEDDLQINILVRNPMKIPQVLKNLENIDGLFKPFGSKVTTCGDGIAGGNFELKFNPTQSGNPDFMELEFETRKHLTSIFNGYKKPGRKVVVSPALQSVSHEFEYSISGFTNAAHMGKELHEKIKVSVAIYPAGFGVIDRLNFTYHISGWNAPGTARNPDITDKYEPNYEEVDMEFASILGEKLSSLFDGKL